MNNRAYQTLVTCTTKREILLLQLITIRQCSPWLNLHILETMSAHTKVATTDRSSLDVSETTTSQDGEDSAPLLEEKLGFDLESAEEKLKDKQEQAHRRSHIAFLTSLGVFVCSIIFYTFKYITAPSDAACERKMWAFSPMQEAMEFEWRQYDSDIIPPRYFGEPTEERRAVWELIHDGMYVLIS